MLERVGLMPKSGIEMKIVGLKLEEWDCVQRVGYDTNSGIGIGVQWVRTVRNTGTAVINTVQTGKNQTETGRSFFLGNSKRVGSGLKRVPTAVNGRCPSYRVNKMPAIF